MWLPSQKNEIVTFTFLPEYLICCLLQETNNIIPYTLKAYQRIRLKKSDFEKKTLFNLTHVSSHIKSFLDTHRLHHAFALFSLGTSITEEIISLPESTPEPSHFSNASSKKALWDYIYLHPTDPAQHTFYVCSIQRELLFQYLLLATMTTLNPLIITSTFMGLLHLYHFVKGNEFRNTQLGLDLKKHNNSLQDYFSPDMISPIVSVQIESELSTEAPYLYNSLGLFIARNNHHEKY